MVVVMTMVLTIVMTMVTMVIMVTMVTMVTMVMLLVTFLVAAGHLAVFPNDVHRQRRLGKMLCGYLDLPWDLTSSKYDTWHDVDISLLAVDRLQPLAKVSIHPANLTAWATVPFGPEMTRIDVKMCQIECLNRSGDNQWEFSGDLTRNHKHPEDPTSDEIQDRLGPTAFPKSPQVRRSENEYLSAASVQFK